MKKKYKQGLKDREDESRAMKKSFKGGLDSGYMGMLSEDHSATANLPQEVVYEYYPKREYMDSHYLDDTIKGVDDNNRDNISRVDSHQSDSMY